MQQTVNLTKHTAEKVDDEINLRLSMDLTRLHVSKSQSVIITPVIQKGDSARAFPAVVVNGRQRHMLSQRLRRPADEKELARRNGTEQKLD